MEKNIKIAITGGIGSGKSSACAIIKELNYPIISSDDIVKKLYREQKILRGLKKIFPSAIKGFFALKADKAKIAQIAFSDEKKYKELNDFFLPKIIDILFKEMDRLSGLVFAEVPLLFESNLQDRFDKVIVIKRDLESRIESVKIRSNLDRNEVLSRINMQFDYSSFKEKDEIVIDNDGDLENLRQNVKVVISKLQSQFNNK